MFLTSLINKLISQFNIFLPKLATIKLRLIVPKLQNKNTYV